MIGSDSLSSVEGTGAAATPSELLDKIAAVASDLPDITEMIHGGPVT